MSVHKATIVWSRQSDSFDYAEYNRDHSWDFESVQVAASAAPGFFGDAERVDPEEAFVASLSSCHMLTFLALASKKRFVVDSYRDEATGILAKNADGKLAITRVTLRPVIGFSGERRPDASAIQRMHERSHQECFIANSVRTEVIIEAADA